MDMMFPPPLSLARAPYVTSVSFRCHLPPILYRLYRDAPATASTIWTNPSASFDTARCDPQTRRRPSPRAPLEAGSARCWAGCPSFRASVKRRSLFVFMCLHVPSIPARTCAGESGGWPLSAHRPHERYVGAIEVCPARESEKAMSWPEVTVKAVNNSDEVSSCARRQTIDVRWSPPHCYS